LEYISVVTQEYVSVIGQWMIANIELVLLALSGTVLGALIIFININFKLSRILKKYNTLMKGVEGENLERMLLDQIKQVDNVTIKVDNLNDQYRTLKNASELCLQRIGMIRFNAFKDTGSDLSFSVAILDANNDGVVISSIFGRDESRVYGKPVQKGKSQYSLSDEEQAALQMAQGKK
jgi:hypothetical protein